MKAAHVSLIVAVLAVSVAVLGVSSRVTDAEQAELVRARATQVRAESQLRAIDGRLAAIERTLDARLHGLENAVESLTEHSLEPRARPARPTQIEVEVSAPLVSGWQWQRLSDILDEHERRAPSDR